MCDRKDWAIDMYRESREIVEKEYREQNIYRELYNTIKWELILVREHMDDSDHITFRNDIYKVLMMSDGNNIH